MNNCLLLSKSNRRTNLFAQRTWSIVSVIFCMAGSMAIVPQSALAQVCGTPGQDGVGSPGGVVNTYYPGTTASGTTVGIGTMRSGGGAAIGAGDLVLIMQMQDGSATNFTNTTSYGESPTGIGGSVGSYEYARVASVSGSTLTLAKALTNTYYQATPTGSNAKQSFQVIRVPQYVSASLSAGVTALAWDGSSGGIVALDVYNTLNFSGQSIDVTGKGFRGGGSKDVGFYHPANFSPSKGAVPFIYAGTYGGITGTTPNTYPNSKLASFKGEGTAGTPLLMYNGTTLVNTGTEGYPNGDVGRGAPGNAGGGGISGGDYLNGKIPGHDGGGGGGGNIGKGGVGGDTWSPSEGGQWPNGGFGGSDITASFTKILMGGGGGAGITTNSTQMLNRPVADGIINGGPGGGIVFVRAGSIDGIGSITAKGVAGTNGDLTGKGTSNEDTDAGGGGGAGGSVSIAARSGSLAGLTINVSGGNGADSTYQQHGPGGGGGGGLVAYGGGAADAPTNVIAGGEAGFDEPQTGSGITATHYGSKEGDAGKVLDRLPHTGCTRSNVLIVKRITAINGLSMINGLSIAGFVDNPATTSDNDPNWPTDYLKGAIDIANVKPNDEIEYTIYYLNSGNVAAKKLRICDRLHKNLVFQTQFDLTSATVGKGINLTPGTNIPEYFTNADGDDKGYLSTTSTLPTNCNLTDSTNLTTDRIDPAKMSDNVVVVDLADSDSNNYLPGSISPGNPTNSYGYIRFKAKVKP